MTDQQDPHAWVQEYYGKTLQGTADLKTNACCAAEAPPEHLRQVLAQIHPEVAAKFYGCGLVIPPALTGLRVLDLGSGSGRDCFVLSRLVGPQGRVTGVDMTPEQLALARQHVDYHRQQFGFATSNLTFLEGDIERLEDLPLAPGSFDLIVSNCVVNLAQRKDRVFAGAFNLLAPGGEFYFSDVYADRRIPPALRNDSLLYGECLSGALYWNDFLDLSRNAGFADPRIVAQHRIEVQQPDLAAKLEGIQFHSLTLRLFKLSGLESHCEDYGQAVRYKGTLEHHPKAFALDATHRFETGRMERLCGNSYRMLQETRFAPHFEFFGDFERHFGLFPGCGQSLPFIEDAAVSHCC